MATTTTLFSLLFVTLCCLSIGTVFGSVGPTIHFHNAFQPGDKSATNIVCGAYTSYIFGGQSSIGPVTKAGEVADCKVAHWGKQQANFNGYDPKRDGANKDLYFKLNHQGVFLSYDNIRSVKVADWFNWG